MSKLISIVTTFAVVLCLASCGGNSKSSVNVPTEFCDKLVKLAEGGNAEAQYRLGLYYGENAQSAQEGEKCVSLLQNSANQDFAPAKIVLSRMYTKGMGVPQDDQMAKQLLAQGIQAAEKGEAITQLALAFYYEQTGHKDEYFRWLNLAVAQNYAPAQFELGYKYIYGDGISPDMLKGFDLVKSAAEQGFASAQFGLGCLYERGEGVKADLNEAMKWYRKAAEQGNRNAVERLKP